MLEEEEMPNGRRDAKWDYEGRINDLRARFQMKLVKANILYLLKKKS